MKFTGLKLFRSGSTIEAVIQYLSVELANGLRDLYTGLSRLNFDDNFQGFTAELSFSGANELRIRHNLGVVPTKRIILRATASDIVDGTTPWDDKYVFMRKTGSGAATATVVFLR
jgi:hypothetical protein